LVLRTLRSSVRDVRLSVAQYAPGLTENPGWLNGAEHSPDAGGITLSHHQGGEERQRHIKAEGLCGR